MGKLSLLLVLGALSMIVAGCGDPAPSTTLAPDLPKTGTGTGSTNVGAVKSAEHASAPADRQ